MEIKAPNGEQYSSEMVGQKNAPVYCSLLSAVNGGWSTWSDWSTCDGVFTDVPANTAMETLSLRAARTCDNPGMKYPGAACVGQAADAIKCERK